MRDRSFVGLLFAFLAIGSVGGTHEGLSADEQKNSSSKASSSKPVEANPDVPPLPLPRYPDPSLVEIQKQLQDIIQIHQSLEKQRTREMAEIQKIIEQSRMHQRLLVDLANTQAAAAGKTKSEMEEAVRRQKIRIIEEQALKNRSEVEKLRKKALPPKK